MKTSQRAFSLIELSVVITVIGLLAAAIMQGSALINLSKKTVARFNTRNSEVQNIKGLSMWFDAVSADAFLAGDKFDSGAVKIWRNTNPSISPEMQAEAIKSINWSAIWTNLKFNAIQPTEGAAPKYIENGINGLPVLRFEGTGRMAFNGESLVQTNYTIFVVEKRANGSGMRAFIGGTLNQRNTGLLLAYENNDLVFAHYANDLRVPNLVSPFSASAVPRIHAFVLSQTQGKKYVLNGTATYTEPLQTEPLISYNDAIIGMINGAAYIGDIGEIIIFLRALKNEERQMVEKYLSKKWNIPLQ